MFYYGILILLEPGFQTDDFVVFSHIKANCSPISFNPKEIFYLFIRPVSYFSFWLDYHLFGEHATVMKIVSLLLFLAFLSLFYFFLLKVSKVTKVRFDGISAFFICLIFSLHADTMLWIIWISNRTELLYMFFYLSSLILAFNFITSSKVKLGYLTGFIACYLLSIFSKQQSLHLPLLMILLVFILRNSISKEKFSLLFRSSLFLSIVIPVFSIINFSLYGGRLDVLQNLWKKPFSIVGILVYSIFPFWADSIYGYFVNNKYFAALLLFLIFLFVAIVILKNKSFIQQKHRLIKAISLAIIFSLIVFFPRIFLEGQNRINSIQIFWVMVLFYYFSSKVLGKKKYLLWVLLILYCIVNANYSIDYLKKNKFLNQIYYSQAIEFNRFTSSHNCQSVILTGYLAHIIPYESYFIEHGTFGKKNVTVAPSTYFYNAISVSSFMENGPVVSCFMEGDQVTIKRISDFVVLRYFVENENVISFNLIEDLKSDVRGSDLIKYRIPPEFIQNKSCFLYYDGCKWNEYKKSK